MKGFEEIKADIIDRLDTAALKKELPDVAKRYTVRIHEIHV